MASKKKKITLSQLLAEREKWSLLYCSEKYQYYCDYKDGDWTEVRKIKKSIVVNYLDNKKGE